MNETLLFLFCAGFLASSLNAAAGGGSFVSFPALISAGVSPLIANTSSTVALLPGSVASAWAYRRDIRSFEQVSMKAMLILTFIGGGVGALLLLYTPAADFNTLVPWLLLTGSLAFAFGRQLGDWLRSKFSIGPVFVLSGQFLLGIYGGYFGGAVGIMMLAVWSIFGLTDIRRMNANRTILVTLANTIAVVLFIAAGKVAWLQTCWMLAGTILGGYYGARLTRMVPPRYLRLGITIFNFVLTAIFFIWR